MDQYPIYKIITTPQFKKEANPLNDSFNYVQKDIIKNDDKSLSYSNIQIQIQSKPPTDRNTPAQQNVKQVKRLLSLNSRGSSKQSRFLNTSKQKKQQLNNKLSLQKRQSVQSENASFQFSRLEMNLSYNQLQTKYNNLIQYYKKLKQKYHQLKSQFETQKQAKQLYIQQNQQFIFYLKQIGFDLGNIQYSINTFKQIRQNYESQKYIVLRQEEINIELLKILQQTLQKLQYYIEFKNNTQKGRYIREQQQNEEFQFLTNVREFIQFIKNKDYQNVQEQPDQIVQQQIQKQTENQNQTYNYQIAKSLLLPQLKQNSSQPNLNSPESIPHRRYSLSSERKYNKKNIFISDYLQNISEKSKEHLTEKSDESYSQRKNRQSIGSNKCPPIWEQAKQQLQPFHTPRSNVSNPINHQHLYETLALIQKKFSQLQQSTNHQAQQNKKQIKILRQQINHLQQVIIRLRQQILQLECQLKQRNYKISNLITQNEALNGDIFHLDLILKQKTELLNNYEKQLKLQKQQAQKLQEQISNKNKKISQKTGESFKLQQKIRELILQNRFLLQKIEDLKRIQCQKDIQLNDIKEEKQKYLNEIQKIKLDIQQKDEVLIQNRQLNERQIILLKGQINELIQKGRKVQQLQLKCKQQQEDLIKMTNYQLKLQQEVQKLREQGKSQQNVRKNQRQIFERQISQLLQQNNMLKKQIIQQSLSKEQHNNQQLFTRRQTIDSQLQSQLKQSNNQLQQTKRIYSNLIIQKDRNISQLITQTQQIKKALKMSEELFYQKEKQLIKQIELSQVQKQKQLKQIQILRSQLNIYKSNLTKQQNYQTLQQLFQSKQQSMKSQLLVTHYKLQQVSKQYQNLLNYIKQKQSQLSKYQNQLLEYEKQISLYEQQKKQKQEQVNELQQGIQLKIQEFQNKVIQAQKYYQNSIQRYEEQIQKLQEQFFNYQKKVTQKQQIIVTYQQKVSQNQQNINKLQRKITELRKQNNRLIQEIYQIKNQQSKNNSYYSQQKQTSTKQQIKRLSQEINSLRSQNSKLKQNQQQHISISLINKQHLVKQQSKDLKSSQIDKQYAAIKSYQQNINSLEQNIKFLEQLNIKSSKDKQILSQQVKKHHKQFYQLQNKYHQLQKQYSIIKDKFTQINIKHDQMKYQNQSIQERNSQLCKMNEQVQKENQQLREQLIKINTHNKSMEHQIKENYSIQYQKTIQQLKNTIRQLNSKIDILTLQKQQLFNQNKSLALQLQDNQRNSYKTIPISQSGNNQNSQQNHVQFVIPNSSHRIDNYSNQKENQIYRNYRNAQMEKDKKFIYESNYMPQYNPYPELNYEQNKVPFQREIYHQIDTSKNTQNERQNQYRSLHLAYQSLSRLHNASLNSHFLQIQQIKAKNLNQINRIQHQSQQKIVYLKNLNKKAKQKILQQISKIKQQDYHMTQFKKLLQQKQRTIFESKQVIIQKQKHIIELNNKFQHFQKVKNQNVIQNQKKLQNNFYLLQKQLNQKIMLQQKQMIHHEQIYQEKQNQLLNFIQKLKYQNKMLLKRNEQIFNQKNHQVEAEKQKFQFISFLNRKQKLKIHTLIFSARIIGKKQESQKSNQINNQQGTPKNIYLNKKSYNPRQNIQNIQEKQFKSNSKFISNQNQIIYPSLDQRKIRPQQRLIHYQNRIPSMPRQSNDQVQFQPFMMDPNLSHNIQMKNSNHLQKKSLQQNYLADKNNKKSKNLIKLYHQTEKKLIPQNNFSKQKLSPKNELQFIMMTKDKQKKKDHMPLSYNNMLNQNSEFMKPQSDKNLSQSQFLLMKPNHQIDYQPQIKIIKNKSSQDLNLMNFQFAQQQKIEQIENRLKKIASTKSINYSEQNKIIANQLRSTQNKQKNNQDERKDSQNSLGNKFIKSPKYFDLKMLQQNIRKKKQQNQQLLKSIKDVKTQNY